jgi:hypothetical protein
MDRSPSAKRGPTRRALLRGGLSLTGVAALGGCVEEIGEEFPPNAKTPVSERVPELPVRERTEVLEEGIMALSSEEITDLESFADAIEDHGVEVKEVAEELEVMTVEFVSSRRVDAGKLDGIGPIAGAFAALIASGFETTALEITILDPESTSFGAATAETTWAERYDAGRLTAKEYGELVASTIESKRHPPDVGATPDA